MTWDDYLFAPLYLGLPVAVAQQSRRDGLWAALLGFTAFFTMKFPSSGLIGFLTSDGVSPYWRQYFLVLITLVLMVLLGSWIAQKIHPSLAFLAVALWLAMVGIHMPAVFLDYGLYAKGLFAMGVVVLLARLERSIGHVYGANV